MAHPNRNEKHIEITNHAMERLVERVGSFDGYRSWQHLAKTARYYGKTESQMNEKEVNYVLHHFNRRGFTNSMAIRFLDGFFYVFRGNSGHARTLVTVIKYEESN